MYLLYSLLLIVWGIVLFPVFLYKAWPRGRRFPGISQRLGRLPDSLRFDGRSTLWFHACSVGEVLSLEPLVASLHQTFPEARFVFSTITQTGLEVAVQRFSAHGPGNAFYFPIDFARVARRVLDWIRPLMIVIVDTEIWPNILHQAHARGVPVVLANGRISASSFRYYRWTRPLLRRVFRHYEILLMQSGEDAFRIARLGAPPEKIQITGNIKFDRDFAGKQADEARVRDLEEGLGLGGSAAPLIVAGSTHAGEEVVLLEVLRRLRQVPPLENTRMLLAPRHPERFDEVARVTEQCGFRVRRRTGKHGPAQGEGVLLLDTVGELAAAYRFATVAFVGGTLKRHGGHSILEPALFSKPIVIGPYMENFRHILDEFSAHGAVRQISAGEDYPDLQVHQLMDVFLRLLQNSGERDALGEAAFSILEKNRGAAGRAVERIAAIFEEARTRERAGKPVAGSPWDCRSSGIF